MRVCPLMLPGVSLLAVLACGPRPESGQPDSASVAAAAATDPGIVRQTIDANNARFVDALQRADTGVFLSMYADDAVVMQPGMPVMTGKAAIAQGISGLFAQMSVSNAIFTTTDVMVGGDLAVETGTYAMTLTPKGGKAMIDKGKYVTVYKRQADGSWKVVRDITNSDAAPPG